MLKWIRFILDLLGIWKKDIQEPQAAQTQAQVQEVLNHEQKIDAKTAAAKATVAGLSESELDRQLRE